MSGGGRPPGRRRARSLRGRLLAGTLGAASVALLLAYFALSGLFRDHVTRQFEASLTQQLDQLTARLEFDAAGRPGIDAASLSDPRWQAPYSGLYWQIDAVTEAGGRAERHGVLRSRSLWDAELALQADPLAGGEIHRHTGRGPRETAVLMLERTITPAEHPGARWRLIVAADRSELQHAISRFNGVLAASLAALLLLLLAAGLAQVALVLAPLRTMQRALDAVRDGREQRLQGGFPAEVQPLTDAFNSVLDRHGELVARARTHVGNLAHALKTPLTVLEQAAARAGPEDRLAPVVREQVATARRQVEWHLARARAAGSSGVPGARTAVAPVMSGLARVMERVHADRGLALTCSVPDPGLAFAGEEQDLHEMLGNLLDNACRWARREVRATASRCGPTALQVVVEDDGPGIPPERRETVLARGARLDEDAPGSGLGLAIVADLVQLYGGRLELAASPAGGLRVLLHLPAVA